MSIKSINQFLTKVNQDEKLQAEVSQAMSIEQPETTHAKQLAGRELNKSELQSVVGGGALYASTITLAILGRGGYN